MSSIEMNDLVGVNSLSLKCLNCFTDIINDEYAVLGLTGVLCNDCTQNCLKCDAKIFLGTEFCPKCVEACVNCGNKTNSVSEMSISSEHVSLCQDCRVLCSACGSENPVGDSCVSCSEGKCKKLKIEIIDAIGRLDYTKSIGMFRELIRLRPRQREIRDLFYDAQDGIVNKIMTDLKKQEQAGAYEVDYKETLKQIKAVAPQHRIVNLLSKKVLQQERSNQRAEIESRIMQFTDAGDLVSAKQYADKFVSQFPGESSSVIETYREAAAASRIRNRQVLSLIAILIVGGVVTWGGVSYFNNRSANLEKDAVNRYSQLQIMDRDPKIGNSEKLKQWQSYLNSYRVTGYHVDDADMRVKTLIKETVRK